MEDREEGTDALRMKYQKATPGQKPIRKKFKDCAPKEGPVKTVDESAPPNPKIEKWIKANKSKFKDKYGDEKGEEVLYATAWKMYKESIEESGNIVEAFEMLHEKLFDKRTIPWLSDIVTLLRSKTSEKELFSLGVDLYKKSVDKEPSKTKEFLAGQIAQTLGLGSRQFVNYLNKMNLDSTYNIQEAAKTKKKKKNAEILINPEKEELEKE